MQYVHESLVINYTTFILVLSFTLFPCQMIMHHMQKEEEEEDNRLSEEAERYFEEQQCPNNQTLEPATHQPAGAAPQVNPEEPQAAAITTVTIPAIVTST